MQNLDLINLRNFDIKAINLNRFYDSVIKELGVKRLSSLEMGVLERPHPNPKNAKRGVTTLDVAAGHEYGNSCTIPRPFLTTSANKFVNESFEEDVKQEYTYLGAFLKRLAKKLYSTVIECFITGGFGTWVHLSEEYKKRTGRTDPPLIDTGALLGSVYVRYEGYTVSGKTAQGTLYTSTVEQKTKDSESGVTKKRASDLRIYEKKTAEEQQKIEKQRETLLINRKIKHEIELRKQMYIRTYGKKTYEKNKQKIEENWTKLINAEIAKRSRT